MRLKIDDDSNKLKYVSIIRQNNGASIQDIKRNIEDNNVVLECDYFDTDELKGFKKTLEALISKGATVHLFQDNREVQIEYISNLIRSYEQIAEDREKLDDRILGDD
jgi:CTP:phosphocholine cytidylyltransferase-like protein